MRQVLTCFILLLIGFSTVPSWVNAEDYRTDYQVEYFLEEQQQSLTSKVQFTIKITNLNPAVFVKKFSMAFPKSFEISNIEASDDNGKISPEVTQDGLETTLNLEFGSPKTGRNSENNFFLGFEQQNLFKVNGNVWEVILPTIENSTEGDYKVVVNLPENTDKKISIAKPKPTFIRTNQIVWQNPESKTIYAVFGEEQLYNLNLNYSLQNPTLKPVYTDIALPPETLYQKLFVHSLVPKPDKVFIDEDGNYMARYNLYPQEKKNIVFKGTAQLFNKYRPEIKEPMNELFAQQKKYLLNEQRHWKIQDLEKISSLNTPQDIHRYIVDTFQYDYAKLNGPPQRLGAQAVLASNKGVCTEFTDFFVAAARENGIHAREIQGYGFSNDQVLRPLSLTSDILHAWPEFYDNTQQIWVPLDPTWENTSGINYVDSFDLNHIALAIHGKSSEYPAPAGSYKIEDSKDVLVQAVSQVPTEIKKLAWNSLSLPKKINDRESYQQKITIKNEGNVFLWDIPLEFKGQAIVGSFDRPKIISLAPYQEEEIVLTLQPAKKNQKTRDTVSVSANGQQLYAGSIEIIPYYYDLGWKIGIILLSLCVVFLILKFLRRK